MWYTHFYITKKITIIKNLLKPKIPTGTTNIKTIETKLTTCCELAKIHTIKIILTTFNIIAKKFGLE